MPDSSLKLIYMRRFIFWAGLLLSGLAVTAQEPKCYPTNWWVGMKHSSLQIMVHAPGIGNDAAVSVVYPGVKVELVLKQKVSNAI